MSVEDFERLIEENKDKFEYPSLFFHGESFLHPQFEEIMAVVRKHGIEAHITTNVTEVKGIKTEAAVKTLKRICFSFDAPTKEYFEDLRVGAKYDECVANILHFCKTNEKYGHPVEVWINIVRTPTVDRNLMSFIRQWGDIVDFIQISPLIDWGDMNAEELGEVRKNTFRCASRWGACYILYDGSVVPCCDWEPDPPYSFGNIFEQSLEEIWNGEKYQKFRQQHIDGDLKGTYCETCVNSMYGGIDISPIPKRVGFKTLMFIKLLSKIKNYLKKVFSKETKDEEEWAYKANVRIFTEDGWVQNSIEVLEHEERMAKKTMG